MFSQICLRKNENDKKQTNREQRKARTEPAAVRMSKERAIVKPAFKKGYGLTVCISGTKKTGKPGGAAQPRISGQPWTAEDPSQNNNTPDRLPPGDAALEAAGVDVANPATSK